MNGDQQEQLNRIEKKLDKLSVLILGDEGQGGLHRWVHDLDGKVDELRMAVQVERGKILGITIGISTLIAVVGFAVNAMRNK